MLVSPMSCDAPAGWADPIKRFNGTSVWVWQNHRFNLTNRIADEIVPLGVGLVLDTLARRLERLRTVRWGFQGESA